MCLAGFASNFLFRSIAFSISFVGTTFVFDILQEMFAALRTTSSPGFSGCNEIEQILHMSMAKILEELPRWRLHGINVKIRSEDMSLIDDIMSLSTVADMLC